MKKFIISFISAITACCLMINITFCYAASFEEQLQELGYTVDEIVDLAEEKKYMSIPVSVMNLMWKNTAYVRDSLGIPNLGGIYDYYLNQNTRYDSKDRFTDSTKDFAGTIRNSFNFNAVKDENGNITESKIDPIYHVSGKICITETPYDDSSPTELLIQVDINAPKTTKKSNITQSDCYGNVSVSITDKLSGLTNNYSYPCCIKSVSILNPFEERNDISCNLLLNIYYFNDDNVMKTGSLYFGLSKTNSIHYIMNGSYNTTTKYSDLLKSFVYRKYISSSTGSLLGDGWNFGYITTYFVCNDESFNNEFTSSYFGTEYGLPPSSNFDNKFSANTVINNDNFSFDVSLQEAVDTIFKKYLEFYSSQPEPGAPMTEITNNSYNYIEMTEDKEPDDSGGGGSSSDNTEISNSILTNILNSITNLKNGFIDGIEYLFKPSDNLFTELQEVIETKFDFVHQIIELGNIVITADFSDSPPDSTITIYGKEVAFMDWTLYDNYKPVVDGIIIVVSYYFYIQKLIKRIPGIIGGFSS